MTTTTITAAKLSWGAKIGWAAGTHGTAAMIGVLVTFMLSFLTRVVGIDAAVAGLIIFASRFYDMIADPVMGHISDRTRSSIGRRRVYLLWGALACFVTYGALFDFPDFDSMAAKIAYAAVLLFLFNTAYTVFNIPYLAMPAEMTGSYHERTVLMSIRVVFFTTATLMLFGGNAALIGRYGAAEGWPLFGWITGAAVGISMLIAFVATRGTPHTVRSENVALPMAAQMKLVLANRPFAIFLGVKLLQLTAQASSNAALLFFGAYVLNNEQALQIAFAIYFPLGTFIAIPLWTMAGKRFGKRACYMAAALLYAAVMMSWLAAAPGEAAVLTNARLGVLGATVAGILVMGFAILPDTIEYDRRMTGINREGVYAGIYSTMEKLAAAFGPLIFGTYLSAAGFIAGEAGAVTVQPGAAVNAIYMGVAVIPAVASVLSAALLWFYDLSEEKLKAAGSAG